VIEILPFSAEYREKLLVLSLAAWQPVFMKMQPAVPNYVFQAFYPNGWQARQLSDIPDFLDHNADLVLVAVKNEELVGWIGGKIHKEDSMGEIYILAVHPDAQRQGIAKQLMDHLIEIMRDKGLEILMVETGDDPGHIASRATYEKAGFERWPVARYFRKL
jgi:ribosomal protein S18 acetylase RimI-like enzyme